MPVFVEGQVSQVSGVPPGAARPFWSVMIPVYRRTRYLGQALESVLAQDPGAEQMQIEVVDDGSPSGEIEALVQALGRGRVAFFRQPRNLGLGGNWTACIQRARGQWVHILHDDDLVLPGFYARLRGAVEQAPAVGAAVCRHVKVDEDGHWHWISPLERRTPGLLENWIERIGVSQRIQCPAIVVRRSVYEALGGFHPALFYALDWEMWKRIAAQYPIWYEPRPLACFREHPLSHSWHLVESGAAMIADARKAIDISRAYLPKSVSEDVSRRALEFLAIDAVTKAREAVVRGEWRRAGGRIREGLKCSMSGPVVRHLVPFLGWAVAHGLKRILVRVAGEREESHA